MPDMRFAPPPSVRVAEHPSGMNQVLARSFNERLIMSLLLQHGGMTRLQLGQESGLSAQTISVIVRALERDSLISKGEAVRGRIGPPTTPISLNPEGVFSIGLHVDQTYVEAVLVNFTGEPVDRRTGPLQSLEVDEVESALLVVLDGLLAGMSAEVRNLLTGAGLTLPRQFGGNEHEGSAVLNHDFEAALGARSGLEIFIQNDITAAASAEILFGQAKLINDHLFCYVSRDIQPRLILGGRIYSGSAPCPPVCSDAAWAALEAAIAKSAPLENPAVMDWVEEASRKMAALVEELARLVSVPTMILAAPVPVEIMKALVSATRERVPSGLSVEASALGPNALALGAATLPIHSRFTTEAG
ncbi:ROK family protein [Rhodobacterales bacterium]|nr:ROK family protein [Rhodobacterales bacterium]